jgi:hypothetical protein
MIEAARTARRRGTTFADLFPSQYLLSETRDLDMPGWRAETCCRWTLHADSRSRTKTIVDGAGRSDGSSVKV